MGAIFSYRGDIHESKSRTWAYGCFCLNLPQLNHDLGPVAGFLDYPFCMAQNGQLWKETVQIPSGPFRQIDLCISELRWKIQDIDSI